VAGYKFRKIFQESKNKLFLIFAIPVGEFMWKKLSCKK
jgi:glycosyl transferase cpsO